MTCIKMPTSSIWSLYFNTEFLIYYLNCMQKATYLMNIFYKLYLIDWNENTQRFFVSQPTFISSKHCYSSPLNRIQPYYDYGFQFWVNITLLHKLLSITTSFRYASPKTIFLLLVYCLNIRTTSMRCKYL